MFICIRFFQFFFVTVARFLVIFLIGRMYITFIVVAFVPSILIRIRILKKIDFTIILCFKEHTIIINFEECKESLSLQLFLNTIPTFPVISVHFCLETKLNFEWSCHL